MPGRSGRFWGRVADAFIPGNAYNSTTGRWNPATTKTGIAGVIADQFVPGGSNIVGMAANGGLFGSGFATQLRNESIYNNIADQYGQTRNELRDYLEGQHVNVDGMNPQVSVGNPQQVSVGNYAPSIPTMPSVEAQAPWTGLGTDSGNVLHGGMLGNWANGGGGGLHYGNGAGAGTGYGGTSYANDSWGDTARSFGVGGMSGGARDMVMPTYRGMK